MTPVSDKKITEMNKSIENVDAYLKILEHKNKKNDRAMISLAVVEIIGGIIANVLNMIDNANKTDHDTLIRIFAAVTVLGFIGYAYTMINGKFIENEIKRVKHKREKLTWERNASMER